MSVPAAYLAVVLIWSTTPLAVKWSGEGPGFLLGVLGRMGLATILCLALVAAMRLEFPWHRDARRAYYAGALGAYAAMLLIYWAAQYVPSGLISVLFGLSPLVTALLARPLLKAIIERLHAGLLDRVGREILALTGGAIPVGGMLKLFGLLEDTLVLLAGDAAGLANPVTGAGIAAAVHSGRLAGEAAARKSPHSYEEELHDLYGAALERALRRRRELLDSVPGKAALRRGWIAYPEYWQ